jgi:hypothetical protein
VRLLCLHVDAAALPRLPRGQVPTPARMRLNPLRGQEIVRLDDGRGHVADRNPAIHRSLPQKVVGFLITQVSQAHPDAFGLFDLADRAQRLVEFPDLCLQTPLILNDATRGQQGCQYRERVERLAQDGMGRAVGEQALQVRNAGLEDRDQGGVGLPPRQSAGPAAGQRGASRPRPRWPASARAEARRARAAPRPGGACSSAPARRHRPGARSTRSTAPHLSTEARRQPGSWPTAPLTCPERGRDVFDLWLLPRRALLSRTDEVGVRLEGPRVSSTISN